jgi:hypothetical protein
MKRCREELVIPKVIIDIGENDSDEDYPNTILSLPNDVLDHTTSYLDTCSQFSFSIRRKKKSTYDCYNVENNDD